MTKDRSDNFMRWVMILVAQFIILTFIAMIFYAGGNEIDPNAPGYSFSRNFFSSLGLTVAHGQPNTLAAILFFFAMSGGGLGLILFTLAFPSFCKDGFVPRWTSRIGSAIGIISGIFFIGVAFTPADLFLEAHRFFVIWAFQLFPLAVVFYIIAILLQEDYPTRHAFIFALFAAALVAYIWLLREGPSIETDSGLVIQAIGQKIIAYFSLSTIFYQAWVARRLLASREQSAPNLKLSETAA